jgi:hypothetical protein
MFFFNLFIFSISSFDIRVLDLELSDFLCFFFLRGYPELRVSQSNPR